MSDTTHISDDDELLVAYLDGELEPADRQPLETRLADDEALRRRLHRLQQSWDALDELPREQASAAFTASTVSMVAMLAEAATPPAVAAPMTPRGWLTLRRAGWVMALVGLGFLLVFVPRRWHYWRELRDMPVAFNLDRYQNVHSLEFLERLDREGLFVDESAVSTESGDHSPAEVNLSESLALRLVKAHERVELQSAMDDLNPEQQVQMIELHDRFDRLPRSEKRQLRAFHRALSSHPDVDRLTRVLTSFHSWLATLASSARADLLDLPQPERVEEIRRTLLRQLAESPDSLWMDLTPRDMESIREWLLDYLRQHRTELLELIPAMQRRRLSQMENGRSAQLMIAAIAWRLPDISSQLPRPTDEELARLLRDLPERSKRRVAEQVEAKGAAPLFEMAAKVMRAVRQIPRPGNRHRLDEVLNSLPPAERQRLLDLPPDELMRELRRHAERRPNRGEPFGPRRDRRGPPFPRGGPGEGPPRPLGEGREHRPPR